EAGSPRRESTCADLCPRTRCRRTCLARRPSRARRAPPPATATPRSPRPVRPREWPYGWHRSHSWVLTVPTSSEIWRAIPTLALARPGPCWEEARMPGSVIVGSARTPIGKLSGAFAGLSAMDLGGLAIKAALERAGIGAEQVDYVLMGQVLQAGQGQITARQAAVAAGIPMTVPAMTVNKVCLSGINAIYLADQMI